MRSTVYAYRVPRSRDSLQLGIASLGTVRHNEERRLYVVLLEIAQYAVCVIGRAVVECEIHDAELPDVVALRRSIHHHIRVDVSVEAFRLRSLLRRLICLCGVSFAFSRGLRLGGIHGLKCGIPGAT